MRRHAATDFTDEPRTTQHTAAMHKACAGKHFSDIVDDAGNQYIDAWADSEDLCLIRFEQQWAVFIAKRGGQHEFVKWLSRRHK